MNLFNEVEYKVGMLEFATMLWVPNLYYLVFQIKDKIIHFQTVLSLQWLQFQKSLF